MIGYTTGCFDVYHDGHVNFLKNCKKLCNKLIVGVTSDDKIKQEKNREPIFNIEQRIKILESCKYIDVVIEHHDNNKQDSHHKLKYDILFIGDDHFKEEEYETMNELCKVIYIPYTSNVSSSSIRSKLNAS